MNETNDNETLETIERENAELENDNARLMNIFKKKIEKLKNENAELEKRIGIKNDNKATKKEAGSETSSDTETDFGKLENEYRKAKKRNEKLKIKLNRHNNIGKAEIENKKLKKRNLSLSEYTDENTIISKDEQANIHFWQVLSLYAGIFGFTLLFVAIEACNKGGTPVSLVLLALLATGGLEPFLKGRLVGKGKYNYTPEEYEKYFKTKEHITKFCMIGVIVTVYLVIALTQMKIS